MIEGGNRVGGRDDGKFQKICIYHAVRRIVCQLAIICLFFGITGVEGSMWAAVLYCALPFLMYTILCLPLWIYFKVSKKRSIHRNEEHT